MELEFKGQKFTVIQDFGDAQLVQNKQEEHFLVVPELGVQLKMEACEQIKIVLNGRKILLNEIPLEKRSGGTPQNCREKQRLEENYLTRIEGRSVILVTNLEGILDRVCISQFN